MLSKPAALATLTVCLAANAALDAGELKLESLGWGRGILTEGQPSWLEGGFGRLTEGASAAEDTAGLGRAQLHLGLDWKPSEVVLFHVHGLGRYEGPDDRGRRLGITEAFFQYRPDLSASLTFRLRAGTFFPQTSRENVGPLWSSPYTLTFSALNTWIGEEMRLSGLESALVVRSAGGNELQLSGAAFAAADTLGTLVAWRGWSMGDRLATIGETLPLPPLVTFGPGQGFASQQASGTQPIDELDHRIGWQARARWQRPQAVLLQAAYCDNGGDRELYQGQYSWDTRFGQIGGELHLGRSLVVVGEAALGDTGMGPTNGPHVDVRFRLAYLLLSWGGDTARLSARYDRFRNDDRDGTAEPNDESGSAWTVAAFWRPQRHVRLGVEALQLRARRPAADFSGADANTDARRLLGELRVSF